MRGRKYFRHSVASPAAAADAQHTYIYICIFAERERKRGSKYIFGPPAPLLLHVANPSRLHAMMNCEMHL
jgi:hypothetical protein